LTQIPFSNYTSIYIPNDIYNKSNKYVYTYGYGSLVRLEDQAFALFELQPYEKNLQKNKHSVLLKYY